MKKNIIKYSTIIIILQLFIIPIAFSQSTGGSDTENPASYTRTLIPEINKETTKIQGLGDCNFVMKKFEELYFFGPNQTTENNQLNSLKKFDNAIKEINKFTLNNDNTAPNLNYNKITRNDILGCALMTGRISFSYLSVFISYVLNAIAILSGTLSMLFIIFGGYKYIVGALTQNTDDAKNTIKNAIIGLLVSTAAWIIVNLVLAIFTS